MSQPSVKIEKIKYNAIVRKASSNKYLKILKGK